MTSRGWFCLKIGPGRTRSCQLRLCSRVYFNLTENSSRYMTIDQNLIPVLGKQQAQARHLSNFTANDGKNLIHSTLYSPRHSYYSPQVPMPSLLHDSTYKTYMRQDARTM